LVSFLLTPPEFSKTVRNRATYCGLLIGIHRQTIDPCYVDDFDLSDVERQDAKDPFFPTDFRIT